MEDGHYTEIVVGNNGSRPPGSSIDVKTKDSKMCGWKGIVIFLVLLAIAQAATTGFLLYKILAIGGPIYNRWGRYICPDSADLIYTGVAGGTYHTHPGGGVQYLCLPTEPQWGNYSDGYDYDTTGGDIIFGAKYADLDSIYPDQDLENQSVPCAVCRTREKSTTLMIPARRECPSSLWTVEYKGYLTAEHYDHAGKRSYECLDDAPEVIKETSEERGGVFFYPVEASCPGSLPCPGYVEGREVTCVVCSL